MANIRCSAKNCGYNKQSYCNKESVKVEGLFSRSKLGTFCQSFKNPYDSFSFKEEMAKEMLNNEDVSKNTTYVGCSANYCEFNNDNYCEAKVITVGGQIAKYRSETQCDSFNLK